MEWGRDPFYLQRVADCRMIRQGLMVNVSRMAARSTVILAAMWRGAGHSSAADIRVFTSGAPSAALKVIAAKFTSAIGNRVLFTAAILQDIQSQLSGDKMPD